MVAVAIAVLGAGALVAACGGTTGPGVAGENGGPTTTIANPTSGTASPADYGKDVAYAACMRAHGIADFPDPNPQGVFAASPSEVRAESATYAGANAACQHLLPNGGKSTPAENAEALRLALQASACMRAHGVSNFPDPKVLGNGSFVMRIGGPGFPPHSSAFRRAMRECRALFNAVLAVP
jgi:hypothetical protein